MFPKGAVKGLNFLRSIYSLWKFIAPYPDPQFTLVLEYGCPAVPAMNCQVGSTQYQQLVTNYPVQSTQYKVPSTKYSVLLVPTQKRFINTYINHCWITHCVKTVSHCWQCEQCERRQTTKISCKHWKQKLNRALSGCYIRPFRKFLWSSFKSTQLVNTHLGH